MELQEPHTRLMYLLVDINFRGQAFSKAFLVLIILYLKTSATILQACSPFPPVRSLWSIGPF